MIRDRNRNGDGVAIYIRNNINFRIREDLMPEELEALCIEVSKPKSKPFLVATWYRPPNSSLELFNYFEKFLQAADGESIELITGDLILIAIFSKQMKIEPLN